jgi:hypothetical protein
MIYGGDELPVRTRIGVARLGWKGTPGPAWNKVRVNQTAAGRVWDANIEVEPGKNARYRQTATEKDGKTVIAIEVTAETDLNIEGVYLWLDIPRAEFSGGKVVAGEATAVMPVHKPEKKQFFSAESKDVIIRDSRGNLALSANFERPHAFALEDRWDRTGPQYSAMITIRKGALAAGATASMELSLSVAGEPESAPARLQLDASKHRYAFHGFGGNYCFGIESPVTQYTLDNLNVAWARTEMSLSKWAPENDTEGSRLHNEFLLMKQLQQKRIPYVISIWQLPERFYTDPGPKPQRRDKRKIAPDQWNALLDSLGSYLVYAKEKHGVEPDLFSFNEANIGVDVLLNAEEHRDAIKRIGGHFAKLGLKTKMLLADATGPRDTHEYALPAANDPEAMRYVGAVGFHSWGGGTPAQYKAWGDLAEWLGLPLLVSELGVDAAAHSGQLYDSFHYGIEEVKMYQELLLYARPQGTQQWEFTGDYGTVKVAKDGALQPTPRFWFLKHFTDLTPRNSEALGTVSDNAKILFTAFAKGSVYTLHVANVGASRDVTIEGIPAGIRELRAVRTSEGEDYKSLPAVNVEAGVARFRMPARSLLTLIAGAVPESAAK